MFVCLLHAEPLLEAINTSARINQLLLAGEERMAFAANINAQLLLGGTRLEGFAAHAAHDALAVIRMDLLLHCSFTSFDAMIGLVFVMARDFWPP